MPLNDSIKTVYVSVFNELGQELASTQEKNGVSVVDFKYRFDDEDDDRCIIKLQTSEPKAFDGLGIGRGSQLQIKWGYVNGPLSPTAMVVIKDITSKYGKDIIYTEIEASDYISFLKTARSASVGTGPLIEYLMSIAQGRYNIVVMDRGNPIFSVPKEGKKFPDGAKETAFEISPGTGEKVYNVYSTTYQPFFDPFEELLEGTIVGEVLEFLAPYGRWWVFNKNVIRQYLEKDIPLLTTNRSQFTVIKDMMKECPYGPWYVTGRGETMIIHNRYLGREPYTSYTYRAEPGYLIDFTAKTKYENFEKQAISYVGVDPEDKKFLYIDDYRKALVNARSIKQILNDISITDIQKTAEIRDYINLRYISYPKFGSVTTPGAFINPGEDSQFWIGGTFNKPYINKSPSTVAAHLDALNKGKKPDPFIQDYPYLVNYLKNPNGEFDSSIHDPILRALWITVPIRETSILANVLQNKQRQIEMEKEEADIILEGDPSIQSSFNIIINNVHEQHEGIYYAKTAEHRISREGYKVSIEALKVIPEAKITTITGEGSSDIDIEKQYMREQLLFGRDILLTFEETEFERVHYVGEDLNVPAMMPKKVAKTYDLNKLLFEQGLSPDEIAEKIIKQSKSPQFKVEENINVEEY